jgi:hypothetical protein
MLSRNHQGFLSQGLGLRGQNPADFPTLGLMANWEMPLSWMLLLESLDLDRV